VTADAEVAASAEAPEGRKRLSFPFSQFVGQDEVKLALLLNVVDPRIGGVLIMGDRGTGKSVLVRALAELLPDITVVAGDAYNSDPSDPEFMGPEVREGIKAGKEMPLAQKRIPMVEVPLGATEDRICGTIDVDKALSEGVKEFKAGLLAEANRGILYVDEVNLLEDNLVDVLLDSAASGWNSVEREGISVSHPAKFIMIGSGNPEEGEMRPQMLDRFGCAVNVSTLFDLDQRTELVMRRMAYDQDPDGFVAAAAEEQEAIRAKISAARELLPSVTLNKELQLQISEACSLVDIDGLRGDLVVNRTAKALAAFEGRDEVTVDDVERILSMCIVHRLRKDPMDTIDSGFKVKMAFKRIFLKEEEEPPAPAPDDADAKPAPAKKAGSWAGLP